MALSWPCSPCQARHHADQPWPSSAQAPYWHLVRWHNRPTGVLRIIGGAIGGSRLPCSRALWSSCDHCSRPLTHSGGRVIGKAEGVTLYPTGVTGGVTPGGDIMRRQPAHPGPGSRRRAQSPGARRVLQRGYTASLVTAGHHVHER